MDRMRPEFKPGTSSPQAILGHDRVMKPIVVERPRSQKVYDAALAIGYSPLQATILSGRFVDAQAENLQHWVSPSIGLIDPPDTLPDIREATDAIADAVMDGRPLVLLSDFDADGIDAHAVLKMSLVDYFGVDERRVHSVIAHRVKEGYGVTDRIAEKVLAILDRPGLCITADQGSTNYSAIATLVAAQHVVVVTDHHACGVAGVPAGAIACVNPVRPDCEYPDPYIAGVVVAWLVMTSVRQELIRRGYLPATTPKLGALLSFAAVGSLADCMDLSKSLNNRAIVNYGISLINRPDAAPPWQAFKQLLGKSTINATDISFGLAPRLNAISRVHEGLGGLEFLRATTLEEATERLAELDVHNTERKAIEAAILQEATVIAEHRVRQGAASIVVAPQTTHAGVHGVVAGRLLQSTGRPTIVFSPKFGHEDLLTGSMRCPPGIDGRRALQEIADQKVGCIAAFGGHKAAAGAQVYKERLREFADAFEEAIRRQVDPSTLYPRLWTDGAITMTPTLDDLAEIEALAPYGRQFESPAFSLLATVAAAKAVGDGTHVKLTLTDERRNTLDGIWFRAKKPEDPFPVTIGKAYRFVVRLDSNTYRGNTSLQVLVDLCEPADDPAQTGG